MNLMPYRNETKCQNHRTNSNLQRSSKKFKTNFKTDIVVCVGASGVLL